jgi:predicted regulator of Ras-like GTPase activity (Roadblock/LC7/MglB family)
LSFPDVLRSLVAAPGALGAAFLDPHGQPIAVTGEREALETIAAYQSVWLGELGRAAERAGLGELRDVTMEFHDARMLAAEVKHGYFLLVVVDRSGVLAPTRARLQEARAALSAEIE